MPAVKIFGWELEITGKNGIKVSFSADNLNGVDTIKQAFEGVKALLNKDLALGFVSLVPVFSTLYECFKKGKK